MQQFGNISFRKRSALFGVFIAWQMMMVVVAFVPAFVAVPADAATAAPAVDKPITCFLRGECIDPKTVGNCDNQHCFELRSSCPPNQGACYANPPAIPLVISIGGKTQALNLGDYIAIVFNYGSYIAGMVATVMFMVGGFQYLTAGSSDRVSKAKERIKNAIIGLLLTLGAAIILRTVNPDTLKLQMPKIEITKKKTIASCAFTENCEPCGIPYVVLTDKATGETAKSVGECKWAKLADAVTDADRAKYDISGNCIGLGCSNSGDGMVPYTTGDKAACSIHLFRCIQGAAGETFECGHPPPQPKDAPAAAPGTSGGYICKGCTPDGNSCAQAGKNDHCCGGFCAQSAIGGNTCASGQPGDACQGDNECVDGKCQTNWGNSCSNGAIGSPCADSKECKTGFFCQTRGSNTCSPGTKYSYCGSKDECAAGLNCVNLSGYSSVCMDTPDDRDAFKAKVCPLKNGIFSDDCCNLNSDCNNAGGYCYTGTKSSPNNFCTDGSLGAPCSEDWECAPAAGNGNGQCDKVHDVCTDGGVGSSCGDNNDCNSRHCYKAGDFNVCVSGGIGSRCDGSSGCNDPASMDCKDHRCGPKGDAGPVAKP